MAENKRGSRKIQYQIVARYMDGNEVIGYHLQSISSNKSKRYTKEQALLLGAKGQITNAQAIITAQGATLSGKGIKISDLPVVQEQDGKAVLTNADSLGKVVRGTSIDDAINMFKLTYVIKDGKKKVGYTIQNSGGAEKDITREETIELAKQNKIGNAFINMYQGAALLRGRNGFKLDDLPVKDISESTLAGASKAKKEEVETVNKETDINKTIANKIKQIFNNEMKKDTENVKLVKSIGLYLKEEGYDTKFDARGKDYLLTFKCKEQKYSEKLDLYIGVEDDKISVDVVAYGKGEDTRELDKSFNKEGNLEDVVTGLFDLTDKALKYLNSNTKKKSNTTEKKEVQ